ncbi:MBL fold metallo-hydrolase [Sphingomonas hengshuiensis]|uniref:SH3 domain-containing protein n=1 Tax=Sphingomonas hengshuiensis TaxID=1609977 RepID=A0A7U4LGE8_9SPHN|nr:MBL fold metallo-hydrolase [Sphingomonas hengshuiensis]AJP73445.1 hypothetical protein TS85_19125 [Sphingomonas hengshuiensis]
MLFASLLPVAASAQEVVVLRHVTVRAAPARESAKIDYPKIGAQLTLLDGGVRRAGYYHVRLEDGREGWIYQSYVRRIPPSGADGLVAPAGAVVAHFIDVDQGNSALLEFPCGAILIDAGGRGADAEARLLDYLDAFFARRTDLDGRLAAVYVTHTHIDHNASLDKVATRFKVGAYVYNGVARGSGRSNARWMLNHAQQTAPQIALRPVSEGEVEAAGRVGLTDGVIDPLACAGTDPKVRILAGGRELPDGTEYRPADWGDDDMDNGNNHSLVIRVDYGETAFLFPGDIENAAITDLIARYSGTAMLDADVLEVSHHGAVNGTTAPFLAAVSPQVAVMSMGPWTTQEKWTAWAYGHPRKVTTDLLYSAVSGRRATKSVQVAKAVKTFLPFAMDHAVYATGWDGTVIVRGDASGMIDVRIAQ